MRFLRLLPAVLAVAGTVDELSTALTVPGITATRHGDGVHLVLDPPVDAAELADLWGIAVAVAVSGDVHQRTWTLHVAGVELPDVHTRRIVSELPRFGRWRVRAELDGRPEGPLPVLVAGASPAYDVRVQGGAVTVITID